jgi:hypothetical protein
LAFPIRSERPLGGWRSTEIEQVLAACASAIARGEASGWEVGRTEIGDPQLYLLGPEPDYECLICISRLGHRYVLEDGNGRVLVEDSALAGMAQRLREALGRKKATIVARIALAWFVVREAIEERTDAVFAESHEMLMHLAPQLAALA